MPKYKWFTFGARNRGRGNSGGGGGTVPAAGFTGFPTTGIANLSVAFTNTSTGSPTSYLWQKNSGTGYVPFSGSPTSASPTESFSAGTWDIRLTATNSSGSNVFTRTAYITSNALPPSSFVSKTVQGGWRLVGAWALGGMAIDWNTMKCQVGTDPSASPHYGAILEYDLPTRGDGSNPALWPQVYPTRQFYPDALFEDTPGMYCNGIYFDAGNFLGHGQVFWYANRKLYSQYAPPPLHISTENGTVLDVNLPRQALSGFIKRYGAEPWIGGGGAESAQGSAHGPTAGNLQGTTFLSWPYGSLDFNQRAPRDADYFTDGEDGYYALNPANHGGLGCWASDRIRSGGLLWPGDNRVWYCTQSSQGRTNYQYQNETLSAGEKPTLYSVDPTDWYNTSLYTYQNQSLPAGRCVIGMEFNAGATGYVLCCRDAWIGPETPHKVDPILVEYA